MDSIYLLYLQFYYIIAVLSPFILGFVLLYLLAKVINA